jgi:hypothetical protein
MNCAKRVWKQTVESSPGVHDDGGGDDDDDDDDDTVYRTRSSLLPTACLPDSLFDPEDGGRTFLQNIREYLRDSTVLFRQAGLARGL